MHSALVANLPSISSLHDATIFSHVVPALYEGKDNFFHLLQRDITLTEFYTTTNPLATAFIFSLVLSVYHLLLAEVTRNFSQVDRFWSLLPAFYICHFTYYAHSLGIPSHRLDTAAAVSVLWSARLTFNYWRKGGYSWGSEDYRWEIIKDYIGLPIFTAFNWTFISFMQNWLLLSVATPVYLMLVVANGMPEKDVFTTADTIFSRAMLAVLIFEFIADQQQWSTLSVRFLFCILECKVSIMDGLANEE